MYEINFSISCIEHNCDQVSNRQSCCLLRGQLVTTRASLKVTQGHPQWCKSIQHIDFYRATACNATHGIAVAILSVRLSDACIVTKRNNRLSTPYETGISLVFLLQRGLLGIVPLHLKYSPKVTRHLKCSADNCTVKFSDVGTTLFINFSWAIDAVTAHASYHVI